MTLLFVSLVPGRACGDRVEAAVLYVSVGKFLHLSLSYFVTIISKNVRGARTDIHAATS